LGLRCGKAAGVREQGGGESCPARKVTALVCRKGGGGRLPPGRCGGPQGSGS
jgi:hypothetical protein